MNSEIVLSTLNARYSHASLGLRYLLANLGELRPRARIAEFTIAEPPREIAEKILALKPRVVGFGVYIWNTEQTLAVVSILKRVAPELVVVLGGPEVSYENESQAICALADHVICGEGELLFRQVCRLVLAGGRAEKIVRGELPLLAELELPYDLFTDEDLRNRVLYVEASRGCPYKCEYCLSSLDKSVRSFELTRFLAAMDRLVARGARQFKFVDRTFNLSVTTSTAILDFFLERVELGLFIHFEMVPDRLPLELRERILRFPKAALQFEIGVQTWNPEVARLVSRRQDYAKIRENLRFLQEHTGVHTHVDLIAGLPGETIESFARGFDALVELEPDEIQVGILKRLRGTPIIRHDSEWGMVYQEHPPYTVLRTRKMSFEELQRMARFAKHWDLVANSGNFVGTTRLLKAQAQGAAFALFERLSAFLSTRHPNAHGISLPALVESVFFFLVDELKLDRELAREVLAADYSQGGLRSLPFFLRDPSETRPGIPVAGERSALPERQRRHLSVESAARVLGS